MRNAEGVVSVWLGTTHKSIDEFNVYTHRMEQFDSKSPIQIDFECKFIDSDLFVAFGTKDNRIVPVEDLCEEIDCSRETQNNIVRRCHEMGIRDGNSLYYYVNYTFEESEPGRLYNGLRFIGSFPDQ